MKKTVMKDSVRKRGNGGSGGALNLTSIGIARIAYREHRIFYPVG
jgi:hypothetical protein